MSSSKAFGFNLADRPKLLKALEALKRRYGRELQAEFTDSGQFLITSQLGEAHLHRFLSELKEECAGIPLKITKPSVGCRETVLRRRAQIAKINSTNQKNSISMIAEPLSEALCKDIATGKVKEDSESRAEYLQEIHGWSLQDAQGILHISKDPPNVLVYCSNQLISRQTKEAVILAFCDAIKSGPFSGEPIHGCRFNLIDAGIESDGIDQVIYATKECIFAAQMLAHPALMTPLHIVDIHTPKHALSAVYGCIKDHSGRVYFEDCNPETKIFTVKANASLAKTYDLIEAERSASKGQAFCYSEFSHSEVVEDVTVSNS